MSDNVNIKVTETLENIFLKASETEERINITVDETLEDVVIIAQEARDGEQGIQGETGAEGRHIESASFVGDDIVFVNDDATTVTLADAKIELKGDDGYTPVKGVDYNDGTNGADGEDGREIELQKTATYIQWRLVGEASWINIVDLASLKGDKGDPGSLISNQSQIDFGSAPGTNYVTVTVSDVNIKTNSKVFYQVEGSTSTHNDIEHIIVPLKLTTGAIVDSTSFVVNAFSEYRLTGSFNFLLIHQNKPINKSAIPKPNTCLFLFVNFDFKASFSALNSSLIGFTLIVSLSLKIVSIFVFSFVW